ncbi:uncharacterized protein LOC112695001 [Athalia rosae]|uniref:uncharacterized protein LOC112695001 n=1 Tax=Athalia rosae TaxID=37344 RepID=UPI0020347F36|nr:uncharacterized protein LOC112695001 [Athalia rosae]
MDDDHGNLVLYGLITYSIITIMRRVKKKRTKKRRWWVRPMLLDRSRHGHFHNLFKFMTHDNEQFFKYTRMTVHQFEKLHNLVRARLTKSSNRRPLSSEHRLVITIYYLAHGGSMQLTAWSFYVLKSTVSVII